MRKLLTVLALIPLVLAAARECKKEEGPQDTCTPVAMAPVSATTSLARMVTETGIQVIYDVRDSNDRPIKVTFRIGYQMNSSDGDVLLVNGVPFAFTRNRTFNTGRGTDTVLYGSPGIQGRLTYHAVACVPGGTDGVIEVVSLPARSDNLVAVEGKERATTKNDGKKHNLEFQFATNVPTTLIQDIGPK